MNRVLTLSLKASLAAVAAGAMLPGSASAGFFDPPASLPSENGAIVRDQAQPLSFTLAGTGTRIMYKSTDSNGQPVAVTGSYIEPKKSWTGPGARPLVSFAMGTQGQGDPCAPSYALTNLVSGKPGSFSLGYDQLPVGGLLDRGFAVVVTDYVGLGAIGRIHTYVNRVDQGHAVLDAARAALNVPGASVTAASPVGTFGYSQGGGASAAAAELAPTYAPDVNLKGAYAGAPPADLLATLKQADGTILTAVIGYAINGFLATYPQLRPILDRETNSAGKAALKQISTQCIGDSIFSFAFKKTSTWTNSRKTAAAVVASIPEVLAIVDEQKIGKIKPEVPVRIVTGTQDDIVPHAQAKRLAVNWCALGANVQYTPEVQALPSFGTALNHLGPGQVWNKNAQDWLSSRMLGKPSSGNCGSVSRLP